MFFSSHSSPNTVTQDSACRKKQFRFFVLTIRRDLSSLAQIFGLLRVGFGQVGPDPGLVHGVQQVLGVQCQGVSGRQHLLLTLLLQRRDGVLLGQAHLADQLAQVLVQEFLGALDLRRGADHAILVFICPKSRAVRETKPKQITTRHLLTKTQQSFIFQEE